MPIYTHQKVDLDAACSVWGAKQFINGAQNAEVIFRPANWDGCDMKGGDIALDMNAGGRGMKGKVGSEGVIHSCFRSIIERYAPDSHRHALTPAMQFVDLQDAYGSAVKKLVPEAAPESQVILAATSLNAVFRALQHTLRGNDAVVCDRMGEILSGMLLAGLARQRAVQEANSAEFFGGGKVALVTDAREPATNSILFEELKVRVIVFVNGNVLGLTRAFSVSLRMDHPELREIIEASGDDLSEWFAHPAGFLFCRGSRKTEEPKTPSKVNPRMLAEAVAKLLA